MITVTIRPVSERSKRFEILVTNTSNNEFFVRGDFKTASEAAADAANVLTTWQTTPTKFLNETNTGLELIARPRKDWAHKQLHHS
jgi:hypothetical protein